MGKRWVLGIDSGGTKAIGLLVSEDGTVAGVGFGGPTNQYFVAAEDALVSLRRVIRQAVDMAEGRGYPLPLADPTDPAGAEDEGQADSSTSSSWQSRGQPHEQAHEIAPATPPTSEATSRIRLDAAYLSAPGLSKEVALTALRERFVVHPVALADDAEAAFVGALPGGEGAIALAGTGSFAYARRDGQVVVKGGWGPLLGDEGSGYWIALEALKAVIRAYEHRGPPTSLAEALQATLRYSFPEELRRLVYGAQMTRHRLAGLAMLVSQEAASGDAVAQQILQQAGQELGALAVSAARELSWPGQCPVSLTGGVARAGQWVQEAFRRTVKEALPQSVWVEPAYAPCVGAALLALRLAQVPIVPSLLKRLEASLYEGFRPFLPMMMRSGAALSSANLTRIGEAETGLATGTTAEGKA
ncbi:MAG: hypothetical protein IMX01_06780 [Limnochordaceae bacterium]|nr:hypothetical protein [Limnochordaceae bacterium]